MRICLIAEGSYPYVTGGVSSWINQLMNNMPEHEFIIVAINPDSSKMGQYKYSLPPNLKQIHDLFLDNQPNVKGRWNQRIPWSAAEIEELEHLILSEAVSWPVFFQAFCAPAMKNKNAWDVLLSDLFYNLVRKTYAKKFSHVPFAQVYWTLRSMYLTVFTLLFHEYPTADIYHSVSAGYAGLVGAYAAHANHGTFMMTEHGIYTREREEELIKADWVKGYFKNMWIDFFHSLSNCAYTCADQVVTLFNQNKNIEVELGCPENKILVIHNGIDINKYTAVADSVKLRLDPQPVKVGAIIRVVPIKDIKTMLQAFALVCKKIDKIEFYIMGPTDEDPDYYDECMQYKNMLKLDQAVFTGRINIQDYLKDMDLLVLTSISEGQPLAILEGLACTLPFVTTNVGDCSALIDGTYDNFGPAGRVVPVMDYVGLSESIIELCNNHGMRRKYGQSGFERVKEKYSFNAFIQGYKDIYARLSGGMG